MILVGLMSSGLSNEKPASLERAKLLAAHCCRYAQAMSFVGISPTFPDMMATSDPGAQLTRCEHHAMTACDPWQTLKPQYAWLVRSHLPPLTADTKDKE